MAETANFSKIPNLEGVTLSSGNTAINGTGTILVGFTGAANGSRVDKISFKTSTSSATTNMARVFVRKNTGSTWKLITEVKLSNKGSSESIATSEEWLTFPDGIALPAGAQMGYSCHNSARIDVVTFGGNY